uniref:G-protein coupled receptors family 3 profile domain-containing protein n=1 Tax=Otolemur garnettii TaxID=30611 RepID=H0XV63_OTOGA
YLTHSMGLSFFSHHLNEVSGFKKFIQTVILFKYPHDTHLTDLWFVSFNCSMSSDCRTLENCPPNASMELIPWAMLDKSYNVYNGVYAVTQFLHEMLLQQVEMQPAGNGDRMVVSPWQLHPFLRNIHFKNPAGDPVNLDEGRKLDSEYDILNFWNFPEGLGLKMKVGQFTPYVPRAQQLSVSEYMNEWTIGFIQAPHCVCSESCGPEFRRTAQEGRAACCFDCIPYSEKEISNDTDVDQCVKCPDLQYASIERSHCLPKAITFLAYKDPLGMALVSTALCLSVLTLAVLGVFANYQDTSIVKANNRALSYILLILPTCCFLCSLLFIDGHDTATCILQHTTFTTFGVVFTVAVSTALAKTIAVVLAFQVTAPGRRMRHVLVSGAPNSVIPICSLVQLTICGTWLGTSPPFVDTDSHSEHSHIIIVCSKGLATAFHCVLGYLGCLGLGSFAVAFLARNLPDTFNEAKFLTFSMLVFCSIWITFLLVYHSTKGKVVVAMEVFSILASGAGLLGCIFAPKCYIILLRPDRNTFHGLRDKSHSHSGSNNPS